ncbi:hypothetical protein H072_9241 [Dactylellina haptotyla CBS 200.50]|uniref:DASH complex subunit DAD2 n=1 Tax=Dactylellina haptotyla (strain CBS 200.50) TaxID=1284197 RepID=S8A7R1_DACHA|nr:hypothetical protein H072_9241 [Dactylellina haptotyla CBS 200.50]
MAHRFSHFRQSSVGPGFQLAFGSQQAAPAHLVNRINEKKIELENLKQLRDLSANLAKQLRELEGKLGTLTNGTEVVATVLANWHNVLRAISLASAHLPPPKEPKAEGDEQEDIPQEQRPQVYPEMLVRIPTKFHNDEQQAAAEEEEARRTSSL